MQPNIFKIATSELSHDAFFTWLLQWADPKLKTDNLQLHNLGIGFLKLVLQERYVKDVDELISIEAGRQWEGIDVWAEIHCANKKILLILENKTFSGEHSNQLQRYKEIGRTFCEQNAYELSCAYVKSGSETLKTINATKEKGYTTIIRSDLLKLFRNYQCEHPLIIDYLVNLTALDDSHNGYNIMPIDEWDGASWVGFYQFIESKLPVNMWHYVNNPGGGFWNLSLTWEYWGAIPVYTQIEQGKITFKVALSEDETGINYEDIDVNAVQNRIHDKLIQFANANKFICVERPASMVHRGAYRSVGVIKQHVWMGDIAQKVDLHQAISFLQQLNDFYIAFVKHLQSFTYEDLKRSRDRA